MSSELQFHVVGVTDVGRVRLHNEDSIGWDSGGRLAVLADGMGGHKAGDVASKMAVEGILSEFENFYENTDDERPILKELINSVNNDIYRMAKENPDCSRMGSTLAMVCIFYQDVIVSHAGDSRVYRLREGKFNQLTEDHSLIRQLIDQGAMSEEDAENSRYKNVITRALGVRPACDTEIHQFSSQIGDVYLLCSDGLSNLVSDTAMKTILIEEYGNWNLAAQLLIDQANQAGGDDNVSVILAIVKNIS